MAPPTRMRPTSEEEAPAKSSGGTIALIAVIVLLLAGGAFGYWYYQQQQRAPAVAAEKFFQAFQAKDWKTVAHLIDLTNMPSAGPGVLMSEDAVASQLEKIGGIVTISEYKVGAPTITGDDAKVNVSATVKISAALGPLAGTKQQSGDLNMKRVNGEWKLAGVPGGGGLPSLSGGGPGK
jgi:hypothetical protein